MPTPIGMINIMGVGGFNLRTIVECWGNPKSGKSTFTYQTAGMFLKKYKEHARVLICDSEISADFLRMEYAFDIIPGVVLDEDGTENIVEGGDSRVVLVPGMTIEMAASFILKYMKAWHEEGMVSLHVWDSISSSQPKSEYNEVLASVRDNKEANKWTGGMMLKPRLLAFFLNNMLAQLWSTNAIIFLINQARAKIGTYQGGEVSGGGYAFKHDIHYSLRFNYKKSFNESIGNIRMGTMSSVTMDKSKFMPKIFDIPIFIYDDRGGVIDPVDEILMIAYDLGMVKSSGGWYSFSMAAKESMPDVPGMDSKYHGWAKLMDAIKNDMYEPLKTLLEKDIREKFALVNMAYDRAEQLEETPS